MRLMLFRSAVTALFAWSGGAVADPEEPAVTSPTPWALRAQQRLALDPGQQRELRALSDERSQRLCEVSVEPGAPGPSRAQCEEMAALQLEFRQALTGILTPAQLVEWDALIDELISRVHLDNLPQVTRSH